MLDHCKYCLYTDDLVVYLSGPASEVDGLFENMNSDLANIARWVTNNGLVINAKKNSNNVGWHKRLFKTDQGKESTPDHAKQHHNYPERLTESIRRHTRQRTTLERTV